MMSSLMHELNNPLSVASVNVEYLTLTLDKEKDDKHQTCVKLLNDSVERMKKLAKTILEYSRGEEEDFQPMDLKDITDAFMTIMRPQLQKEEIEISLKIENHLPNIWGDKVQLEEVLVNFAQNSLHALKNVSDKKIELKISQKNQNHLRLEFSDNGCGIDPRLLEDIFLPSVSTKPKGEGTGIGLSRVKRIIEFHRGKIWAESDGKNQGAKFIVELPVKK